jgi:hypothetical protein
MYGKILTFKWVNQFLTRHQDQTTTGTVRRQEDPRLQVPRVFLSQYLAHVKEQIDGRNPHLVYNINETGCSGE